MSKFIDTQRKVLSKVISNNVVQTEQRCCENRECEAWSSGFSYPRGLKKCDYCNKKTLILCTGERLPCVQNDLTRSIYAKCLIDVQYEFLLDSQPSHYAKEWACDECVDSIYEQHTSFEEYCNF